MYMNATHIAAVVFLLALQPRHKRLRQRIQTCELVGRASSINITDLLARSQPLIRPTKQHHFTIIIYIFIRNINFQNIITFLWYYICRAL